MKLKRTRNGGIVVPRQVAAQISQHEAAKVVDKMWKDFKWWIKIGDRTKADIEGKLEEMVAKVEKEVTNPVVRGQVTHKLRDMVKMLHEALSKNQPPPPPVVHGKTCQKFEHDKRSNYHHLADDDRPYPADVLRCGRCHEPIIFVPGGEDRG